MDIVFTKISDEEHSVEVYRRDNSSEENVLNSRSFLRHDFAHLAIELEVPLKSGYWGSVAAGESLSGLNMKGNEIGLAESLAGPVQTLMREEANITQYADIIKKIRPELASDDLAARIHERARKIQGLWRATPYGEKMLIEWPEGF